MSENFKIHCSLLLKKKTLVRESKEILDFFVIIFFAE